MKTIGDLLISNITATITDKPRANGYPTHSTSRGTSSLACSCRIDDEVAQATRHLHEGHALSMGFSNSEMVKKMSVLAAATLLSAYLFVAILPSSAYACWPLQGQGENISLAFGQSYISGDGDSNIHHGVDCTSAAGSEVVCPKEGTVCFVGSVPQVGTANATMLAVSVKLPDGKTLTMMPFSDICVDEGQQVAEGQPVGVLASKGDASSSVPHLHVGLKDKSRYYDPSGLLGIDAAPSGNVQYPESQTYAAGIALGFDCNGNAGQTAAITTLGSSALESSALGSFAAEENLDSSAGSSVQQQTQPQSQQNPESAVEGAAQEGMVSSAAPAGVSSMAGSGTADYLDFLDGNDDESPSAASKSGLFESTASNISSFLESVFPNFDIPLGASIWILISAVALATTVLLLKRVSSIGKERILKFRKKSSSLPTTGLEKTG